MESCKFQNSAVFPKTHRMHHPVFLANAVYVEPASPRLPMEAKGIASNYRRLARMSVRAVAAMSALHVLRLLQRKHHIVIYAEPWVLLVCICISAAAIEYALLSPLLRVPLVRSGVRLARERMVKAVGT